MDAVKSAELHTSAIELTEVVSSSISRIGYEAQRGLLYVKFMSAGWYAYKDVPAEEHQKFIESGSKGKHFHLKIRPTYLFARIAADENDMPIAPKVEE